MIMLSVDEIEAGEVHWLIGIPGFMGFLTRGETAIR
jgi:hypothetical protein